MANPIVHFEVNASDATKLAPFYAELFGWHTETMQMGDVTYVLIDTHAGSGINGGIAQPPEGAPRTVTLYAEDPDIQAVLDKAVSLGATVMLPVSELPMVTLAIFSDPQGNVIGLVKSASADDPQPGVSEGSNPAIDWFEILGTDGKALRKFYSDLFGWKFTEVSEGGMDYGHIEAGKRGIGGGVGKSPTGGPMTTAYAAVDDLDKYIERAETLGGKKVMGPMNAGEVSFAQFADPQGNVFGLYKSTR